LALIFAPQPGEETRKRLREKTVELQGIAEDATTLAKIVADQFLETGKTVVDEQRERAGRAWQEGKEAAAQTTAEMLARLEETQRNAGL